ncbi:guanine deaminase [soil metagenome]
MRHAIRSAAISFRSDPFLSSADAALAYWPDALIVIDGARIESIGDAEPALRDLPADVAVTRYEHSLVSAGFVDAHVHYPQTSMIAAPGRDLLDWLERYTFPVEAQFGDIDHARGVAGVFMRELLSAGTTTASVYCTVHPQSVDAFFEESTRWNTRMVAGKMLMDRHAPAELLDTPERAYDESRALIDRWHRHGRQHYAVSPRFAPTSTPAQLEVAGQLLRETEGAYLQTHLAENLAEGAWVAQLFPDRESYLDVYAEAGLVGPRTMLGHAIHLDERDWCTCHRSGAAVAHCPTSNLFLGSGLCRMAEARRADRPVRTAIGSDVGGGTRFSLLENLAGAYQISQLAGSRFTATQAFWLATRGGAQALYLDDRIGAIEPGFDADLVVLDLEASPLLALRGARCRDLEEQLFVLMTLADSRAVRATWVAGCNVYVRDREPRFMAPV